MSAVALAASGQFGNRMTFGLCWRGNRRVAAIRDYPARYRHYSRNGQLFPALRLREIFALAVAVVSNPIKEILPLKKAAPSK